MKWNSDYKDLSNVLDILKKSIFFSVFCVALAFVFISLGAIEVRAQGSCATNADCVAPDVCENGFCGRSAVPNDPDDGSGPVDPGGGGGGPIDPGGTICITDSVCDDVIFATELRHA